MELNFSSQNNSIVQQNSTPLTKPKAKKQKTKIQLKAPTQERSRNTVATILEACGKILIREGFFGVTTDKIAKEAGVSIGSLYQFFGNKESVVSAVIHDMFEKDREYVMNRSRELDSLVGVHEKIDKLIEIGIDTYHLHFELRTKLQSIQTYLTDEHFYKNTMLAYQDLVAKEIPAYPNRNPQQIAFIIVTAFVGLMDKAILETQQLTKDESFQNEVKRLFVGYACNP